MRRFCFVLCLFAICMATASASNETVNMGARPAQALSLPTISNQESQSRATVRVPSNPEPSGLLVLLCGVTSLGGLIWRKRTGAVWNSR
ncbi:MAG: hypothetical protein Q7N50_13975 [Armatimonadota bacterium]|nr:hypothetical protein [Armatimonadota bacterium]